MLPFYPGDGSLYRVITQFISHELLPGKFVVDIVSRSTRLAAQRTAWNAQKHFDNK